MTLKKSHTLTWLWDMRWFVKVSLYYIVTAMTPDQLLTLGETFQPLDEHSPPLYLVVALIIFTLQVQTNFHSYIYVLNVYEFYKKERYRLTKSNSSF